MQVSFLTSEIQAVSPNWGPITLIGGLPRGSRVHGTIGFYEYDFLLLINCTRGRMLHRFRDISPSTYPTSLYLSIPLAFYPRPRGSPGTIFVKFCMVVNGWLGYKMARNIVENFNRLSRVHERYRRQTTDRIAIPITRT